MVALSAADIGFFHLDTLSHQTETDPVSERDGEQEKKCSTERGDEEGTKSGK